MATNLICDKKIYYISFLHEEPMMQPEMMKPKFILLLSVKHDLENV